MTDVSGRSQKQFVRVSAMMRFTRVTKIDKWFIDKIAHLVEVELQMKRSALDAGSASVKRNVWSSRIM